MFTFRILQRRDDMRKDQWDDRNVDMYEILTKIGEGTYGEVFKARDKQTGSLSLSLSSANAFDRSSVYVQVNCVP
jgi:serine/threonine protein kinase